jgi:formyl-CoA transferase
VRLSGAETTSPKAPPRLGEHTDEVLHRLLAMSPDEIAGLRARGIV